MVTAAVRAARQVAEAVPDPELPMVTLADLGILRAVAAEGERVVVTITPTYSGCPALREIAHDLRHRLTQAGFTDVIVRTELAPAWSSDWISAEGRRKLAASGIVPPVRAASTLREVLRADRPLACPRCQSIDTECISEFGSTPCKALHRCRACLEPFEYFKCI